MSRREDGQHSDPDKKSEPKWGPNRNYYRDTSAEFTPKNIPEDSFRRTHPPLIRGTSDSIPDQLDDLIFIAYTICMLTGIGLSFSVVATASILILTYV